MKSLITASRSVEQTVLLEATYNQPSAGYVQSDYGTDRDSQPQMYLHPFGEGEVLYLSLGHCTGKHDMKPMVEVVPVIRGSWNNPVYYELLRREPAPQAPIQRSRRSGTSS